MALVLDAKKPDPKAKAKSKPNAKAVARAQRNAERAKFIKSRQAERAYARQLRQIARHVGNIIGGFAPHGIVGAHLSQMKAALSKYSDLLRPWAGAVAARMIKDVSQRDERAWQKHGRTLGVELKRQIATAPIGQTVKRLMGEQVDLITSLPREAGERVHHLTVEALTDGTRAKAIHKEIARSGQVTANRAMLIARTEVARTASNLNQARAQHIGSTHYIWRTSEDADVRHTHKVLNGKVFAWNDPPVCEETGERAHPGTIWNCRCFAEPILGDL